MRVCVVGSGGREHALARAMSRSPEVEVILSPGNPGITAIGRLTTGVGDRRYSCSPIPPEEVEADLFVIGPEAPLVAGLADRLRARGCLVFGPGADGARLEGSKSWMKQLLVAAGVPTASYGSFTEAAPALAMLARLSPPFVVKTDGLAAGKGVLVTESHAEAADDVRAKLDGSSFGQAGRRVVIEEGLVGVEVSIMAVCDGKRAVPLAAAQDFKRAGDGDSGPNTGGMGAYSPVPQVSPAVIDEVMDRAIEPTMAELRRRGIDYRGVLYAGLMLTDTGPKVLEYNVRFGDPEAQVVLQRWDNDVLGVLAAAAAGDLSSAEAPSFSTDAAVCVVLASPGYPLDPRNGETITGLGDAASVNGVHVYAAGVAAREDGQLVTAGGRVLGVTGMGPSLTEARQRAYSAVDMVTWPGIVYRGDIASMACAAEVA